jgi:transposase
LDFLRRIDATVPKWLDIHVVLDNYATHKTEKVRAWLAAHPRFQLHFTPTHSSWINMAERFFGLLSQRWLKRATHRSTRELERAIYDYLERNNEEPKPFIWTKSAEQILDTIARYCQRTLLVHAPDVLNRTSGSGH